MRDVPTEPLLLGEKDGADRPLFVDAVYENTALAGGRLLGRQALYGDGIAEGDIVGYAGDWSKAVWGAVGGITYDVSTQATVTLDGTLTSRGEHNLVAIRAEAEYGVHVDDPESFVKLESVPAGS